MTKKNKHSKEEIAHKRFLKLKYRKAFDIVKKHVDSLDLMGLFEMHCPEDEYEFEIIDIVKFAIRTKDADMLADIIIKIFNESFGDDFKSQRKRIVEAAKDILAELRLLNPNNKETYFIPKDLLPGSCFFEFQKGKYKTGKHWFSKTGKTRLDSSLYLYGDDDGNFDYSAIAPFACLINGSHADPKAAKFFDYCGMTFIDENDGKRLVENLKIFAGFLGEGMQIYEAFEKMKMYNTDGGRAEEDSMKKLDLIILKNTAEELADWAEKTLVEYEWISVLGI